MSSLSSSAAPSKVSFTVRRPTPISRQGSSGLDSDQESTFKVPALPRHLTQNGRSTPASPLANGKLKRKVSVENDSSDEEEEDVDEIVTGFDQFGVQRCVLFSQHLKAGFKLTVAPFSASLVEKKKDDGPLIIPALANRDWREVARKRKAAEMFVPASGAAKIGADGSVGGLGTRDSINSGPVVSGLVKMEKKMRMDVEESSGDVTETTENFEEIDVQQETDDEVAMRALLSKANGETEVDSGLTIGPIQPGEDVWRPADEAEAFRHDVVTRPEQASLEDYTRVPVEQFGIALLRGMGWKPGQAASRKRTGPVEPYLPAARPALLGIGAKEREAVDDGSKSKKAVRPERRYVPLVKKDREGSGKDSAPLSRRASRSPDPDRRRDKDRDRSYDRNGDRVREKDRGKDRDYDYDRRRDRDRDYMSDRDRRERQDRDYQSDRSRGKDSNRDGRKDDDRRRDKDRRRWMYSFSAFPLCNFYNLSGLYSRTCRSASKFGCPPFQSPTFSDFSPFKEQRAVVFEHVHRRLAVHRNNADRWAKAEAFARPGNDADRIYTDFVKEINKWVNTLVKETWVACEEPGSDCPTVDPLTDTSTRDLAPLPSPDVLSHILNTILLLHITSTKHYSAHTRAFLLSLSLIDEVAASATLRDPAHALADADLHTQEAQAAQAKQNRTWRALGVGGAAIAGGVLVGVTGGLAAPLVGAGVSTLLSAVGLGGSAAGVLAAGLASSSAVCGALFGVYGAKEGAEMVARHTKDIADFAIVPVKEPKETLAVRICVSGWLGDKGDVTAPWTIFDESEDTFALQWEVEALRKLSSALGDLVKSHAIKYVKSEIIKRTFLAALFSSLSPIALLKIGQVIDNPWANARALALKTGKVLGTLLAAGVFGTRPVTLTGYSLGALVVLAALEYLADLPPAQSMHLVQDVFLLGTPAPADGSAWPWTRARRVVAGRLVNVYTDAESDYVLALLSRVSFDAAAAGSWGVAGLQPVAVAGVENVKCEGVEGHI
ncbi:hypothetical protein EW145_g1066, partial [Phellinidium pouzarii]